ncbi:MAG: LbetaH domain-containing protein [Acidobacteriaceae bacterium]
MILPHLGCLRLHARSPRIAHGWRAWLLRCFGAKLGPHCRFYPASRVWAPWNLRCEDTVMVADGAELYNPAPMFLASHAIVSQGAYLCGATHDINDPKFPVISFPMRVGRYAWVAARACISPGVNLGDGAILGLASVATKDLEPWSIYAGVPAQGERSDTVRVEEGTFSLCVPAPKTTTKEEKGVAVGHALCSVKRFPL